MDQNSKDYFFYSGTSGLVLPVPNKTLYPTDFQDKSRLEYYASLFSSIEINSSFYKVPLESTVFKWAQIVPDHFRFTFKLWKGITHNKGLEFKAEDIQGFMKAINAVHKKKGCLLIQFPPSLTSSYFSQLQKLIYFIRAFDPDNKWDLALEFRHPSWYEEDDLLHFTSNTIQIVLHDKPRSSSPFTLRKDKFVYLRFHGPEGRYRGSYATDVLHEYGTYIKEWLTEGKTVYAYFNNTMGDAVKNLIYLNRILIE